MWRGSKVTAVNYTVAVYIYIQSTLLDNSGNIKLHIKQLIRNLKGNVQNLGNF